MLNKELHVLIPFPGYEEARAYLDVLEEIFVLVDIPYDYLFLVNDHGVDLQLDTF